MLHRFVFFIFLFFLFNYLILMFCFLNLFAKNRRNCCTSYTIMYTTVTTKLSSRIVGDSFSCNLNKKSFIAITMTQISYFDTEKFMLFIRGNPPCHNGYYKVSIYSCWVTFTTYRYIKLMSL